MYLNRIDEKKGNSFGGIRKFYLTTELLKTQKPSILFLLSTYNVVVLSNRSAKIEILSQQ